MIETYPNKDEVTANWAFERYQAIRHALPNTSFPAKSTQVGGLTDLANHFDVFLLDAFGVLVDRQQRLIAYQSQALAAQYTQQLKVARNTISKVTC